MTPIKRRYGIFLAAIVASISILGGCASVSQERARSENHWSGIWGSSAAAPATNGQAFNNQTVRVIAHASAGGEQVRVRIANTFGAKALAIGGASLGLQSAEASISPKTVRALTFGGHPTVSIPPGALILSDPVSLSVPRNANLAVSVYLPSDTGPATAHPGANQTSYVSNAGNFVTNEDAAPFASKIQSWPFVAGIEVRAEHSRTLVTFGDSITDGYRSTVDANRRWPDYLNARLIASGASVSIVNAGISGNRLLHDSAQPQPRFGPNALSRFDRDALTVSGVTHIVTLIGINDIGMGSPARNPDEVVSADEIIAALNQLLIRGHARGLKVIGATLLPFRQAAYFTEEGEVKRQAVNKWIRANKEYDGFIDFDKVTQDPANPSQMLARFDSGDHLHPNDAGYEAMAASIDLALFK